MRRGRWAALLVLLASTVGAADDAARAQVEQRLRLTASLIADGPAAQRIVASGDPRANAHLDEGRVHHALARDLYERGDLPGARRATEDAIRHLGLARRLVPDATARQAAVRQRHEQLIAHLDRLLLTWRTRTGPLDAEDGDLVAAIGLIDTARAFGREQRYEEAVHTLHSAEGHVLTGLNRALQTRTLDYTARAASPAEEFEIELARHGSLLDLVPLALAELKPRPDAQQLIERYTQVSQRLRTEAQASFQAGDVPPALAQLRNAVLYAQRALSAAGLNVPQTMTTP